MDELTELIHRICGDSSNFDVQLFVEICELNRADMSKYDRVKPGWQGRLRTVGRNLIAKRIHDQNGIVVLPLNVMNGSYRLSSNWMRRQRFKSRPKHTGPIAGIIGIRTR